MAKKEKGEDLRLEQQEKGTMLNTMSQNSLSVPLSDSCHWHSPRARMQSMVFFQHQLPNPGPTVRGGPVKVLYLQF